MKYPLIQKAELFDRLRTGTSAKPISIVAAFPSQIVSKDLKTY
jgi:hypothetical protein